MKILVLSGSVRTGSRTKDLIKIVSKEFSNHSFIDFDLSGLPLFMPDAREDNVPQAVSDFKTLIIDSDAILLVTPEYLHNIPAILKSALEWTSEMGEWAHKKVLAVVFTPNAPRGEKAMVGLLNTMAALNANVLVSFLLHHDAISLSGLLLSNEAHEIWTEAFYMLNENLTY